MINAPQLLADLTRLLKRFEDLSMKLGEPMSDKEVWAIYRKAYKDEPFMRVVKESSGIHRYPEPKILSGSNYCDVGFERDPDSNRLVVMAALDNLMKGAAGQAELLTYAWPAARAFGRWRISTSLFGRSATATSSTQDTSACRKATSLRKAMRSAPFALSSVFASSISAR